VILVRISRKSTHTSPFAQPENGADSALAGIDMDAARSAMVGKNR